MTVCYPLKVFRIRKEKAGLLISTAVYCGGRRNVTHGKADNGEIPAIGEIAAITTFSSGEDEQVEVVSDD